MNSSTVIQCGKWEWEYVHASQERGGPGGRTKFFGWRLDEHELLWKNYIDGQIHLWTVRPLLPLVLFTQRRLSLCHRFRPSIFSFFSLFYWNWNLALTYIQQKPDSAAAAVTRGAMAICRLREDRVVEGLHSAANNPSDRLTILSCTIDVCKDRIDR
jgi:hypothetical protein